MHDGAFTETIMEICRKDQRFDPDAYVFIREALDYTAGMLDKPKKQGRRHVSGGELLEGIRLYALHTYGPMTLRVLRAWGIEKTEDMGDIVFNMVESGILGSTKEDRREDFAGGYDFKKAFEDPFLPRNTSPKSDRRRGPARQGELKLGKRRNESAHVKNHKQPDSGS